MLLLQYIIYIKKKEAWYYNSRQLGLLQITTTGYYNSRQLLLQFTTGITIHDNCYYNSRQVLQFTTEHPCPEDTWEKSLTLPPLTSFANGQLTLDPKPTDKVTMFATPKAILKLKTNVHCSQGWGFLRVHFSQNLRIIQCSPLRVLCS